MSHAKHATKDNRKNPEYHVVAAIRKLRTDKNCSFASSQTMVSLRKNEATAHKGACEQIYILLITESEVITGKSQTSALMY